MAIRRGAIVARIVVAFGCVGGVAHAEAERASPSSSVQGTGALTLGIGASDWNGDYGAKTDTNIAAVLLTGLYKIGPLRLSASAPWMRIESDGAVYAGVDGTPLVVTRDAGSVKHVRQGFGDLTLGAAYLVATPSTWGLDLDTFVRVKLPTSPGSTGLSTGSADYSVGMELSRPIGRLAPFVSVRYRSFGDAPTVALRDGFAGSVGGSYVFSNRVAALVSYDYAERASRFIADSHEISASVSAPLPNSPLRVTGFASAGLSSGAADISGGLSVSLRR